MNKRAGSLAGGRPGRLHCPWWAPGERGQSLIEFAIVLPVFLLLFFGIVEFGIVLLDQTMLRNASRTAARAGAIQFEFSVPTPFPIPDPDRIAQANAAAQASAAVLVSCPLASPTATVIAAVATPTPAPDLIRVDLQCHYHPITPIGAILGSNHTLSSSTTRYVEPP